MARFLVFLSLALLISSYVLGAAPVDPVSLCIEAALKLDPCMLYIMKGGDGPSPTDACCTGVDILSKLAKSRVDRIVLCYCFKKIFWTLDNEDIHSRVAGLPNKCGISYTMPPTDKTYNCNKISMFSDDEGVVLI
ncbi:non-specific lipid-transfer protein 1 isoform X3 [Capsicum galapagoense]